MSYMRSPHYVYSDGDSIYLPTCMSMEIFDALVMMRYHELTKKQIKKAEKKAYEISGAGNFGCDALAKKLKKQTAIDWLKKEIKNEKKEPK